MFFGRIASVCAASAACGLAACSSASDARSTLAVARDGEDMASVESASAALVSALVVAASSGLDLSMRPALLPDPCATVAATPSGVDYHFAHCEAPYGIVGEVDGDLHLDRSFDGPLLQLALSAQDLTFGTTLFVTWTATATVTGGVGNAATMVWRAHIDGRRSARGSSREFSRAVGPLSVRWGTENGCVSVDGESTGTFAGVGEDLGALTIALAGHRRCGGSCADSGSTIYVRAANGTRLSLHFLSDGQAQYTDALGQSFAYAPLCQL